MGIIILGGFSVFSRRCQISDYLYFPPTMHWEKLIVDLLIPCFYLDARYAAETLIVMQEEVD
jgi:hypothetical protein